MGEKPKLESNVKELSVKILDLENVLYEGMAKSVSSINDKGSFDVLPLHSNFITLIEKRVIVEKDTKNKLSFDITSGVLICKQNQVRIYLGL